MMRRSDLLATPPAVFSLSPRAGGNSDAAARHFAAGVAEVLGLDVPVLRVADHGIGPCTGCGTCDGGAPCPEDDADVAQSLYQVLAQAPFVFLSAPVYFYHLPSQAKAWIDRSQQWYMRRAAGDPEVTGLPRRDAYCCLVAGRPRGERLFEGALLTCKYFLDTFNLHLRDPLTLRGVDEPGDLDAAAARRDALMDLGRAAARRALED